MDERLFGALRSPQNIGLLQARPLGGQQGGVEIWFGNIRAARVPGVQGLTIMKQAEQYRVRGPAMEHCYLQGIVDALMLPHSELIAGSG